MVPMFANQAIIVVSEVILLRLKCSIYKQALIDYHHFIGKKHASLMTRTGCSKNIGVHNCIDVNVCHKECITYCCVHERFYNSCPYNLFSSKHCR